MPVDYKFIRNCCMNIIANRLVSQEDCSKTHDVMMLIEKNKDSEDIEFWKSVYKKIIGKNFGSI